MSAETDLLDSISSPLARWRGASAWIVAYSGGLDSTVLLHLLARARAEDGPALRALHVNHGLQAEADAWEDQCRAECAALGLPLEVASVAVEAGGQGPEAAAREARYAAFEARLAPGECLFMAHHLDDQVETFLLRLLRGAGLDGLAGIPDCRPLGAGQIVRPLLGSERAQLEVYAREHGLRWIDDPSNLERGFDRNFLRHEVLPELGGRWPAYRRNIARSVKLLGEARAELAADIDVPVSLYSAMGDPGMEVALLLEVPTPLALMRLRAWLQAQGLAMPDAAALQEFVRQLQQAADEASPRLDCGAFRLGRYRHGLYLLPPETEPEGVYSLRVGQSIEVAGVGRLQLLPSEGPGIALGEGEAVEIHFGAAPRVRPAGRGGSRALKKLAQEAGIPPWWRSRLPLVYAGEELLAVAELCFCESSRWVAGPADSGGCYRLAWERNSLAP